jgi:hypothetical protein
MEQRNGTRIDKSRITVRQPPLRLTYPSPRMARLCPITDADKCYALAAHAWHYPPALDPLGRASWAALLAVWPRKPGQPPNHYLERLTAWTIDQGVASAEDLARVESIEKDSVQRRARRGFERIATPPEWTQVSKPAVVIVTGAEAAELVGKGPVASEPSDPLAGLGAWNESLLPDSPSDEKNYREARRIMFAAAGVTLD